MKVLALLRPAPGVDARREVARHAEAELRSLWSLYRGDLVREMYSPGGPGAVLVLEAASGVEAAERLDDLPLLRSGTMTLEVIELHPFRALEMMFRAAGAGAEGA